MLLCASGSDRIERVVLAGPPLPSQPADLEHPLLMAAEESSETRAERAGALDQEGTPAGSMLIGMTKHAFVPLAIRDRGRLEHHTAARCGSTPITKSSSSASIRTDLQPRLGDNSGAGLGMKPRAARL